MMCLLECQIIKKAKTHNAVFTSIKCMIAIDSLPFFSFGATLPRPKAPRHERIEAFMTFIIKTFHSKPAFMKKECLADADSVGTQNTFSFCIWACAKSLSNCIGGRSLTTSTKF